MEILWEADSPLTVRDVLHRLTPTRKLAYTTVMTAAFFFIPLLATLRDGYRRARELVADDSAVHQAGRLALAGAVYKLLTHPLSLDPESCKAVGA